MRLTLLAFLLVSAAATAQQHASGLLGDWRDPGGSVIRIAPCGDDVCLSIARVRHDAPSQFDIHNPDASLRTRPLCGMTIGRGFRRTTPEHAEGGSLYDPKSGRTYRGEMTARGDRLDLRGYVGAKLFGRTETWTRAAAAASACSAA